MKWLSRSRDGELSGRFAVEARSVAGVRLWLWNVTLARRIELTRAVHEITVEQEFHAGGGSERGRAAAVLASLRAEAEVLRWGLAGVDGLVVDGVRVGVEDFVEKAPERLAREALREIQRASALTELERKN